MPFPGSDFHVIAFNANGAVTGVAASLACTLSIDGGPSVALPAATETGFGGYAFTLTSEQRVGSEFVFSPRSSVSGVQVVRSNNVIYGESVSTILAEVAKIEKIGETIEWTDPDNGGKFICVIKQRVGDA